MTTIVGLETSDGVVLGADVQATTEGRAIRRAGGKIHRLSDNCVMATAGATRAMQIVRNQLNLGDVGPNPTGSFDAERWVICTYVPLLKQTLEDHGWLKSDNGQWDANNAWCLLGVCDKLFAIWSDLQVERTTFGFHALGSGMEYALGALKVTEPLEPLDRVRMALEAAEYFDTATSGPFDYIETK